jgi:steroid delta-isomerase
MEEIAAFYQGAMVTGAKLALQGQIRTAADHAAFAFQVSLDWEGKHQTIDVIDTFRFNDDGKVVEMRAFFGPGHMQAG